ncbi:hypothetical protein [Stenotrophomonas indicatrix]|uniref:Uncharacterized protein n=1 Tax=Stenotrophomonas indicatrix TaxID=2045451 RepID=A0ABT8QFN7_9GAMM|nr:hypothetical protein [Stenotrophomonas indicatrix]MDN8662441.1 hypothetical protein [Stenotrophomonas indicatrix]MDN8670083.1 hypothetical protein [Stenotrophomonas indicatrix]PII12865.1 hypothetical protein CR918_14600 [Stenotrophomonas indicatrix]
MAVLAQHFAQARQATDVHLAQRDVGQVLAEQVVGAVEQGIDPRIQQGGRCDVVRAGAIALAAAQLLVVDGRFQHQFR